MIINRCYKCPLSLSRKNIVNGSGSKDSLIMVIGEAPGYTEDKKGIPFVGRAGKLLWSYFSSIGFTRDMVYVTNVVKCHPPGNRTPDIIELGACYEYLVKELVEVNPEVVVVLGATAIKVLFQDMSLTVNQVRGRVYNNNNCDYIIPTYHPSAILRSDRYKKEFEEDFELIFKTFKLKYPEHEKASIHT